MALGGWIGKAYGSEGIIALAQAVGLIPPPSEMIMTLGRGEAQ